MGVTFILVISAVIAATAVLSLFIFKKISNRYKETNDLLKKELAAKTEELVYLKQKQTKFWDVISHEIRFLFYSFYNAIELLNTEYDNLNGDTKKELINNISKSYDQTLGIINELMEWVKANRNRQNSTPEYVNLSHLVEENITFLKSKLNAKNLTVEKNMGENIPVYCDKMMIDFVIKGILGNAIKFSHRNSTINISCNKVGQRAELIITDEGIGIPKENLDMLFNLDEIISTVGTEKEKGSGLGLIVCKDFVNLNNGKLTIRSEFGKGTSVSVVLLGTDN